MNLKAFAEAALFVSGKSMSAREIARVFGIEDKPVKAALDELVKEYSGRDCGIEVFKTDGKYGMRVKPELEERVLHLVPETDMPKAMLKTLALIAYEQPVKQSYVVKLRGNRVYKYVKRLEELGFIERKPEGHTRLLTTTPKFNQYFKINDAKELVKADLKTRADRAVKEAVDEAQTRLDESGEVVVYDNLK
jgi:segregation and condensation protein B